MANRQNSHLQPLGRTRESVEWSPADQTMSLHAKQNEAIPRTLTNTSSSLGHLPTSQHSSRKSTWAESSGDDGEDQPLLYSATNRGSGNPAMTRYTPRFLDHTIDAATELALVGQHHGSIPTADHQSSYYGNANRGLEYLPTTHYDMWPGNPTIDAAGESRTAGHDPDFVLPAGYQAPYFGNTIGRLGYPATVRFGTWLGNDVTNVGEEAQIVGQDPGFVTTTDYQPSIFDNMNGGNRLPSNQYYTPLFYNGTQVGFGMPSDNELEDYVPTSAPRNHTINPHVTLPAQNPKSASEDSDHQLTLECPKKKKNAPFANLIDNIQSHQISHPEGKIPHRGATKHTVLLPLATSNPDEFIERFPNDLYDEYGWIVARNFGKAGAFIERIRHFHGQYDPQIRTLRWKNAQGKQIARLGKELFGPLKGWRYKVPKVVGEWMDPETWRDEGRPKPVFAEVEEKEVSGGSGDGTHADTGEDSVVAGEKEVGDGEVEGSDADTFEIAADAD